MYLEILEYENAISFLNDQILREKPYLVIQHLDSISLLWRIEMAGYEIPGDLWKSIVDIAIDNSSDCYVPYNSAHYIYALARAGRKDDLSRSLYKIETSASQKTGHEREVWEKTGLPLLQACKSYAIENYSQSTQILEPIINNIMTVGGSDAQVDLFRQTYLLSLIKSGEKKKANIYLEDISTSEIPTPLHDYWKSLI